MLQNASSCRFEGQPFTLLHAKKPAASQLYRPLTAGWHSSRRAAAGAAQRQPGAYTEAQQNHIHEVTRATHGESTAVAASGLAALLLFCPGPVFAEELQDITQDAQSLSILLPAGSLAANLSAAEAPALVSNSGEVLLEGVKGIVESGLQDLAANSMTAVGGPVTGDVLKASASDQSAVDSPGASITAQQQLSAQVQEAAANNSMPAAEAAPAAQQQQQNGQHMLPSVWCGAWQAYCDALERSPLPTKVYTGIVGTLLGDLAAQVLSHTSQQQQRKKQHTPGSSSAEGIRFDAMRAGRLCLYSAVVGTPMGHGWYGLLESAVMPATPLAPAAVAAKVALDQLVQTPLGMALFFATMKVLEGKPREVQQELHSKMLPALLANWKLWPAAQLINFALIPEEQRILYGNVIGICWTCVISNLQQASAATGTATAAASSSSSSSNSRTVGPAVAASGVGGSSRDLDSRPAGLRGRLRSPSAGALSLSRRSSSSMAV